MPAKGARAHSARAAVRAEVADDEGEDRLPPTVGRLMAAAQLPVAVGIVCRYLYMYIESREGENSRRPIAESIAARGRECT